jgi:hypothetical protein
MLKLCITSKGSGYSAALDVMCSKATYMKFVILLVTALFSQLIFSCSCLWFEGTTEERVNHLYKNSENVFSALITQSVIEGTPNEFGAVNNSFHILKKYKGNPAQWDYISTEGNNGSSCTSRLATGDEYLFFIDQNRIGHCSWVIPKHALPNEQEFMEILESLSE